MRAHLPRALRHGVFGALALAYPKLDEWPRPLRFKTTFEELAADSAEGYANSVAAVPTRLREGLYSPTLRGELAGYRAHEVIARHLARAGGDDPLSQAQYADLKTWLPGRMLVKVDRASMAASLEVRVPLLDHHLVEWAASLPPRLRLNGGEGKHILKHAMEPLVDHDILYRPKQGFAPPVAKWLRGPLREELRSALTDPRLADCGHLDMRAIGDLVDDHLAGRRDHSQPLWAIWMFAAFLRQTDRAA